MFQYNPTVNNVSGEIYGRGLERSANYDAAAIQAQAEADLIRAQRRHQMIMDGAGIVGDAAKKVVGFMVGGPAGAAMAMQGGGGGGGGEGADSVIGSFVSAYANNKALEAKGSAYGDFMKRHGSQLGFDPEWIKDFTGRDPREQAMIGDSMLGMQNMGQYVARNQYAETYMQPRGGGGGGGGGGGAGSQPFFTVR